MANDYKQFKKNKFISKNKQQNSIHQSNTNSISKINTDNLYFNKNRFTVNNVDYIDDENNNLLKSRIQCSISDLSICNNMQYKASSIRSKIYGLQKRYVIVYEDGTCDFIMANSAAEAVLLLNDVRISIANDCYDINNLSNPKYKKRKIIKEISVNK